MCHSLSISISAFSVFLQFVLPLYTLFYVSRFRTTLLFYKKKESFIDILNTQMGSAIPSEKLDRNNFASWEYKMHQYLVSQGYWSYIKGAQENRPDPTTPKHSIWEQAASRVLYFLATCVHEHMFCYIWEAKTLKEAWGNLKNIFAAKTTTRKLQLREELNNI